MLHYLHFVHNDVRMFWNQMKCSSLAEAKWLFEMSRKAVRNCLRKRMSLDRGKLGMSVFKLWLKFFDESLKHCWRKLLHLKIQKTNIFPRKKYKLLWLFRPKLSWFCFGFSSLPSIAWPLSGKPQSIRFLNWTFHLQQKRNVSERLNKEAKKTGEKASGDWFNLLFGCTPKNHQSLNQTKQQENSIQPDFLSVTKKGRGCRRRRRRNHQKVISIRHHLARTFSCDKNKNLLIFSVLWGKGRTKPIPRLCSRTIKHLNRMRSLLSSWLLFLYESNH